MIAIPHAQRRRIPRWPFTIRRLTTPRLSTILFYRRLLTYSLEFCRQLRAASFMTAGQATSNK